MLQHRLLAAVEQELLSLSDTDVSHACMQLLILHERVVKRCRVYLASCFTYVCPVYSKAVRELHVHHHRPAGSILNRRPTLNDKY